MIKKIKIKKLKTTNLDTEYCSCGTQLDLKYKNCKWCGKRKMVIDYEKENTIR